MPHFLIRRVETNYRELVVQASDADAALEYASELDYSHFHDMQDLSSETELVGPASADDVKNLPVLDAGHAA